MCLRIEMGKHLAWAFQVLRPVGCNSLWRKPYLLEIIWKQFSKMVTHITAGLVHQNASWDFLMVTLPHVERTQKCGSLTPKYT